MQLVSSVDSPEGFVMLMALFFLFCCCFLFKTQSTINAYTIKQPPQTLVHFPLNAHFCTTHEHTSATDPTAAAVCDGWMKPCEMREIPTETIFKNTPSLSSAFFLKQGRGACDRR